MTRFRAILLAALLSALLCANSFAQTTWLVNSTNTIGGFGVSRHGTPVVTTTPYGDAVLFNGINQGLTITNNPIAGWTNFTVEMIFRPDPTNGLVAAGIPRIFHIAAPNANQIAPDHRLTLEGRITNNTWYADTFIRYNGNAGGSITLIDPNKTHPVGVWHQLAVTYDGAVFKQYVNGTLELSGSVLSGALTNGVCSIGMRANTNNFFFGAVLSLRFTPRVLATNEFMCVPKIRYSALEVSNETANADFTLTAGLPIFTLQEATNPSGNWSNSPNATLTTLTEGSAYRFSVPTDNGTKFFRVVWP